MLLLKQDITRKEWIDKKIRQINFDTDDNDSGKYKVEAIRDSTVYTRESKSSHLLEFYYLVSSKNYPEKENT